MKINVLPNETQALNWVRNVAQLRKKKNSRRMLHRGANVAHGVGRARFGRRCDISKKCELEKTQS